MDASAATTPPTMPKLPAEVWSRVFSHLKRQVPRDVKLTKWKDMHQRDLATVMRVSSVFHEPAAKHLYTSIVTSSPPLLLYGLDSLATALDSKRMPKSDLLSRVKRLVIIYPDNQWLSAPFETAPIVKRHSALHWATKALSRLSSDNLAWHKLQTLAVLRQDVDPRSMDPDFVEVDLTDPDSIGIYNIPRAPYRSDTTRLALDLLVHAEASFISTLLGRTSPSVFCSDDLALLNQMSSISLHPQEPNKLPKIVIHLYIEEGIYDVKFTVNGADIEFHHKAAYSILCCPGPSCQTLANNLNKSLRKLSNMADSTPRDSLHGSPPNETPRTTCQNDQLLGRVTFHGKCSWRFKNASNLLLKWQSEQRPDTCRLRIEFLPLSACAACGNYDGGKNTIGSDSDGER